ncbi:hypothetical protein AVEN_173288-1 [Araneus ventricosus]|uniref:STPR domain-containing protein n=1 Tax=Araneus ventricosus TaxID=182803 RepID=A0A4Y2RTP3_ARAVE|nr:hypothetical protein AVEN_173288-1 [Araneus ventricosus]
MDPKASSDLTSLRPGISHYSRLPVQRQVMQLETEEQRNSRLSDMAQRGQERRAEETEEQRNRRLAVMRQRSQQRRAEETEEQRKENTFWAEHNVYVSDNICKKNKSEAGI